MRIEITNSEGTIDRNFGLWIIQKIQQSFFTELNVEKLKVWDSYLETEPEYKSIYTKKITGKDILLTGIRNLVCDKFDNKLVIRFNNNAYIPGLNHVKVEDACKLITFGNLHVKGYPLLFDIFNEISNNSSKYIDKYIDEEVM